MAPKVTIGRSYGQDDTGAGALIIQELTGDERTLRLSGRGLPYKPISFEGEHRIEEIEAAGFASTSQQPNGPKEKPSSWKGQWKDRFLGDPDDKFAELTQGASDVVDGAEAISVQASTIRRARDLTELVDDMRRKGQLLRVSWLHISRIGRISSFKQDWQTAHDVEWALDFKWVGRDEQAPTPSPAGSNLTNATQSISASYVNVEDATSFDNLSLDANYMNLVDNGVRKLQSLVTDVENNVERRVGGVINSIDAARRMVSTLTNIRDEAEEFVATLQTRAAPAMLAVGDAVSLVDIKAGAAIAAAVAQMTAVRAARELKHTAARQRFEAIKSLDSDILAVVRIKEGQDLRALARLYYKNPEDCEIIRAYNGFRGYTVDVGTVALIPVKETA